MKKGLAEIILEAWTKEDIIADTPEKIALYQLVARKGALKLEINTGMKRHGQAAYSICKQEYGLTGSREAVLEMLESMIQSQINA